MILSHSFNIKVNNEVAIILGHITYAASKLYNCGNYERTEYKKLGFEKMPNWFSQKRDLKGNMWYKSLPSQSAQDVLQRLDEGWKSFFKLKKTKGIENPKPPYYKKDGHHMNVKYLNNSFKIIDGCIRLMISKTLRTYLNEKYGIEKKFFYIPLKKDIENIKQVEFKYLSQDEYKVYVIYEKAEKAKLADNGRYIGIDLGICNLATIYDNKGNTFIISGNTYQNTLYYYNKKIAYYQSKLAKDKNITSEKEISSLKSKRLKRLQTKKNNKIGYIIHSSTRKIVDYCLENGITNVVIGDIQGIREGNDKGSLFNQKLHSLPYLQFYGKLEYKLKLEGINLIYQKEKYTSGVSPKKDITKGNYKKSNRVKRGLYREDGIIYNADCVGAYNILRLYKQESGMNISTPLKGLSNPNKISICVTR